MKKALKLFIAALVLCVAASCQKETPLKPISVNDDFDNNVASYIWENDAENIVIDLNHRVIAIDRKTFGRTAAMESIIDNFEELDGKVAFKTHSPLKSASYRYEYTFHLNSSDELQFTRTAYEGDEVVDVQTRTRYRGKLLSEYTYTRTETFDFYTSVSGVGKDYSVNVCKAYDSEESIAALLNLIGKTHEYVYASNGTTEALQGLDLKGKWALIDRGTIPFDQMCLNVAGLECVGVIVVNNVERHFNPAHDTTPGTPMLVVTASFGAKMKDAKKKQFTVGYDVL